MPRLAAGTLILSLQSFREFFREGALLALRAGPGTLMLFAAAFTPRAAIVTTVVVAVGVTVDVIAVAGGALAIVEGRGPEA